MSNKTLTSLLLIPITFLFTSTALAEGFSDVKEGHKYYVSINYLKEKGLISGYSDNTFKADQNINRVEAIKLILTATGLSPDTETSATILEKISEPLFADTPLDAWYTTYLAIAKEKGLIAGYWDGNFYPESQINLAEALKIYFEALNSNYAGVDLSNTSTTFDDTPAEAWFTQYTSYAGAKGLINIYPTNTVNPNQEMTRGYMAEIIYRYIKSMEGYDFGKATFYFGITGKNNDYYDQNMLTTAHKTLPKGTILEVTNLANGKSVNVKVTDRGPYGAGRVLDLSKTAFSQIASVSTGVITIQYKVVE